MEQLYRGKRLSHIVPLPLEGARYTEEQFVHDTQAASRFVSTAQVAGENGSDASPQRDDEAADIMQRVCDYFYATYEGAEAGKRYLRFGAIHAAIGANRGLIGEKGLMNTDGSGQVDRFLLLLLLTAPVMVNTMTNEAWIPQPDIERAVERAHRVHCS